MVAYLTLEEVDLAGVGDGPDGLEQARVHTRELEEADGLKAGQLAAVGGVLEEWPGRG